MRPHHTAALKLFPQNAAWIPLVEGHVLQFVRSAIPDVGKRAATTVEQSLDPDILGAMLVEIDLSEGFISRTFRIFILGSKNHAAATRVPPFSNTSSKFVDFTFVSLGYAIVILAGGITLYIKSSLVTVVSPQLPVDCDFALLEVGFRYHRTRVSFSGLFF
jgi:hypothetical protein